MKTIILNPALEPIEANQYRRGDPETTMRKAMSYAEAPEGKQLVPVVGFAGEAAFWSKSYLHTVSNAYSLHHGLVVAPHDLWYIVLTELATFIKGNTEAMRQFFTTSDAKQEILVHSDGSAILPLKAVLEQLKARCPLNINILLPVSSTDTPETEFAYAAAVADGVQQYYDYGMFCCGIPKVLVRGTQADWKNLSNHATDLAAEFAAGKAPSQLTLYLTRVASLFFKISVSVTEGMEDSLIQEFWEGIFRQKNVGSGGDLIINGWITDLFMNNKKDQMIKSFPHMVSVVPYHDYTTKKDYKLMVGAFKAQLSADNFLSAEFDFCVAEVVEKVAPKITDKQPLVMRAFKLESKG